MFDNIVIEELDPKELHHLVKLIDAKLDFIIRQQRIIIMNQAQAAQALTDANTKLSAQGDVLTSISGEVSQLEQKIVDLTNAATASGDISPELQTAVDAVTASVGNISTSLATLNTLAANAPAPAPAPAPVDGSPVQS